MKKAKIIKLIRSVPVLGRALSAAARFLRWRVFFSSARYWEDRYRAGRNSGQGSYGVLAEWKAKVINGFIAENGVQTVLELGCGDGNQLSLAQYPQYAGLDVSQEALRSCREQFADDPSKRFLLYRPGIVEQEGLSADLALSLDVIYHLIEDRVFESYMRDLFASARRYVIVYSSNRNEKRNMHVRHRRFTDWAARCAPQWDLVKEIPNAHPYRVQDGVEHGSPSDFFIFSKKLPNAPKEP